MELVKIWTDGACSGNPGPGGWAWAYEQEGTIVQKADFLDQTTNNQAELIAILFAIAPHEDKTIVIHTDSKNAINWLTGEWKVRHKMIKELCDRIWYMIKDNNVQISYVHVKGHSGDPMNSLVDLLAVSQYACQKTDS